MGLKTWDYSYGAISGVAYRRFIFGGFIMLSIAKTPGRLNSVSWWRIYYRGDYLCESPDLHHAFRRAREAFAARAAAEYAGVS